MKRVRILATSDVHGYVYPYAYSNQASAMHGLARVSTLVDALRDENTIVIDNGDILEGSPLSFYHYHYHQDEVSPSTLALNAIKYDFVNLGNHDFNYGPNALFQHLHSLDAPCITSNVTYRDKPIDVSYVIKQVHDVKIAIFGLITHYVPHWEKKENIKHFHFTDAFESAKRSVETIKRLENPDYIVCVYHGGFERDIETGLITENQTGENQGYRMLKEIGGIDILITGHQHRSLCGTKFNKAYTQTACNGQELACIDIDVDHRVITPTILKVDCPSDPKIEQLFQKEEDECQSWLDQPLGESVVDLRIFDEHQARVHKSQVITFLNRVAMDATEADLSGSALFIGATGFDKEITMRNLVSTYVYPNTLVVKEVTGKILKQYLEKCAEFFAVKNEEIIVSKWFDYPKPQHYNYDMVDGIEYTITVSNEIGNRVSNITRNGSPVKDDDVFTLCINNYRASGGGNFDMIKQAKTVKEIQAGMVDLLADYIMKHKVIDFEPVNNITVKVR